ncbi:MAG TPA: alkaline phosphatase family protein [Solirubrobacteraceae bacterium]
MSGGRPWLAAVLVALGAVTVGVLGGCGTSSNARYSSSTASPAGRTRIAPAPRTVAHPRRDRSRAAAGSRGALSDIAVIVMENQEYGDVIGSAAAPFINGLASRYASDLEMYGVTHPSLPNYLALTGGSTFGIASDCTACSVAGATSIVDQLERAHISWRAYMEDLPRPCFTGASAGEYARKHDPFVYYTRVVNNRRWCRRVVPLTALGDDERGRTLPRFIWITPNLCHDMHDCSVATGDRFLSSLVPPLLRSLGPRGVLFITWDEGTSDAGCCRLASGGHVATIVAGPGAKRGARMTRPTDHYSLLETIEDLLGLRRLRGAACVCTSSLKPLLEAG